MSTHNIYFRQDIRNLFTFYPFLFRPMIYYGKVMLSLFLGKYNILLTYHFTRHTYSMKFALPLTLSMPGKIFSRQHTDKFFLFFVKKKYIADNLCKIPSLILTEK